MGKPSNEIDNCSFTLPLATSLSSDERAFDCEKNIICKNINDRRKYLEVYQMK